MQGRLNLNSFKLCNSSSIPMYFKLNLTGTEGLDRKQWCGMLRAIGSLTTESVTTWQPAARPLPAARLPTECANF